MIRKITHVVVILALPGSPSDLRIEEPSLALSFQSNKCLDCPMDAGKHFPSKSWCLREERHNGKSLVEASCKHTDHGKTLWAENSFANSVSMASFVPMTSSF